MAPLDKQAEAERARRALAAPGAPGLAAGQQSDHLLLVAAYNLWQVCIPTSISFTFQMRLSERERESEPICKHAILRYVSPHRCCSQ